MTNIYSDLQDSRQPLATPGSVLTIGAHPDDAEFGAGATLARWASEGCVITMCIVTDGSKGSWDPEQDKMELIADRQAEQRAAGNVLGVSRVVHLGHVDGELEYTMALRKQIAVEIRRAQPEVVLSHDPWQRYQMHPDHRATGLAAVDGTVSAREPLALMDSGLDAHRPTELWLWSADAPDHAEPVTEGFLRLKTDALLCHSSQIHTTMGDADRDTAARSAFVEKIDRWHERLGAPFGVDRAESFRRLTP